MTKKDQYHYTDHKRKQVIRTHWCKEQIKLLSENLARKLVYLGLPGIEGLDILEWIEYLEKVIVFQCEEYKDGNYNTVHVDFDKLIELLDDLENSEKLKTYALYKGFIEDIVIGELDKSGGVFTLGNFITVYNLDFCNGLSTPRRTRNMKGDVIEYYKIDVISRLIENQKELYETASIKDFILYLTVHSNFLESNMSDVKCREITNYRKKYSSLKKGKDAATVRDLKAYTYNKVSEIFNSNTFHCEFLPPIFYQGSSYPNREKGGKLDHHWMLTFTILGSGCTNEEILYEQDTKKYLEDKFLFANDKGIQLFNDRGIPFPENEYTPSPTELLQDSYIFKTLWSR